MKPVDGTPPRTTVTGHRKWSLTDSINRTSPPVLLTNAMTPGAHQDAPEAESLTDYLLVCTAQASCLTEGTWQFVLESADGTPVFSARDTDLGDLNRLTLLAAVRGLESIDGPSSVTLISSSRYLIRSLSDSLPRWRSGGFMWEHFGRRIDVQHADLWRRIDRAVSIHHVQACLVSSRTISFGQRNQLRVDSPHPTPSRPSDPLRRWLMCDATTATTSGQKTPNAKDQPPKVVVRNRKRPIPWQPHDDMAAVLQSA